MSDTPSYFTPAGGLPDQSELLTDRAIVTEAYTVIPKGVLRDIVRRFGNQLALNADVVRGGTIRIGDPARFVRSSR